MYTLHLNSDAGYAVVPLTLLGAPGPVSIGRALGGLMALDLRRVYEASLSPEPGE